MSSPGNRRIEIVEQATVYDGSCPSTATACVTGSMTAA